MNALNKIKSTKQIIEFLELCLENINYTQTGICSLYKEVLIRKYNIDEITASSIVYGESNFIHIHNKFFANQMVYPTSKHLFNYWWKQILLGQEGLNYRKRYIEWMISVYKKIKHGKTYDVIFHTDLFDESYSIYVEIPGKTAFECFDYITNELNNHEVGESTLIKEYSDKFGYVSVICLETKALIMSIPLYDVWNVKEPEYEQ